MAYINKTTMQKTYDFFKKGFSAKQCATVLEISPQTATRIIEIMSCAEKGDLEGLNESQGVGNYVRQKELAREIFGLDEPDEQPKEEPLRLSEYERVALSYLSHNTLMLEYLSSINNMLEKICKELGCEE